MGSHRLYLRAILVAVPLLSLAEFNSSDSQVLSSIALNVVDIKGDTYDICNDVSYIRSHTETILYDAGNIWDVLSSMLSGLGYTRYSPSSLRQDIYSLNADINKGFYGLSNSVSRSINKLSAFVQSTDVSNAQITNQLNALTASINNLTNYLCYSPVYVSTFTNRYSQYFPQSSQLALFDQARIRKYFKFFYGYEPSASEIQDFKNSVGSLALYDFASSYVTLLPEEVVPSADWGYWNMCRAQLQSMGLDNGSYQTHRAIGRSRYYAYGTRDLTDATIAVTNILLHLTNNLYDASFVPSGIPVESAGGVVRSVGKGVDEITSFTDNPDTNIVGSVLDGAITALSDANYSQAIQSTENLLPSDFTDLDGALAELNSISGNVDDIIDGLTAYDTTADYVFEIDYNFLSSGSQTATIIVPNFRNVSTRSGSKLDQIFTTAASIIKLIMFLCFFARGWDSLSRHCYQMGYLPI